MGKPPAVKLAQETALAEAPIQMQPVASETKKAGWRRILVAVCFLVVVVLPVSVSAVYVYFFAHDQFHSKSAFSVRSEEAVNPLDVLGAFTQTGQSSAPDIEVLHDFMRSQTLIELVDEELDLEQIFNRPTHDPFFSLGTDKSVEDLMSYWDWMVAAHLDSNSGVLEIEVRAFAPQDAQNVARAIIGYSSEIIEELSRIAREDAMRYTLEDLAEAEERLKAMRVRIREFRNEYQIIDPEANVESQAGIVSGLESELVASLIELATIERVSSGNDPRVPNIELRIEALREQIAAERAAISTSAKDGRSLTDIIGEYEELLVDLQFSQNAYTAALAAEENARFEANRRSRYLAVHIPPTLAEESIYPARASLVIIVLVCSFAAWSILTLGYYNARDRS